NEAGDQWWTNPYNPSTPIDGLYQVSNGQLNLGLKPVPAAYQTYIDNQAGKHLPYAGTLLNSASTCYFMYGYWEVTVAVDNLPGFSFQACLENWEKTGKWPPEIDLRVTDEQNGTQTIMFEMRDGNLPTWTQWKSQSYDATKMHSYGISWQSDYITYYIDRVQVNQVATPKDGTYTTNPCFWYLLTGANYEGNGDPNVSQLPAYAHVESVKVWDKRPF
ncbi:MAG: family 16 glycosylhydrolase, partial [Chitinivibrionales bacterium]|nr:family 16 glycosylhydrolase [Chitinivibrionales bacterium]